MSTETFQKLAPIYLSGRGLLEEFKAFIAKGNVIQLAVAVVIGAAFGDLVKAFNLAIITPLLGSFSRQHDLSFLNAGGFLFGYLLQAIITFIITAGVIFFFIVKPMNKLMDLLTSKDEAPVVPPIPTEEILLLREIRDALRAGA